MSTRGPGFSSRPGRQGFVVEKVTLGQVCLRVFHFSPIYYPEDSGSTLLRNVACLPNYTASRLRRFSIIQALLPVRSVLKIRT